MTGRHLALGFFLAAALALFGGDRPVARAATAPPDHTGAKSARCELCHTPTGWLPARFAHERTGFALDGQHARATCRSCHRNDYAATLPNRCAGCHRDVHGQVLGAMCNGCHTTDSWRPKFGVDAHRLSIFPLTGRHGMLPCEECHMDRAGRGFSKAARGCDSCHLADYERARLTSVDHRRSNLAVDCRQCHSPIQYRPARFDDHEACFPLRAGSHRGVSCRDCHANLAGAVASGACNTRDASCTQCHTHRKRVVDRQHQSVAGYERSSPKCVGCHVR